MEHYYWNDWYSGWGWFLWFGFVFLFISSMGNWGYTYRAHRKYEVGYSGRDALNILNERYARGEIKSDEYLQMKKHIATDVISSSKDRAEGMSSQKSSSFKTAPISNS